jgi:hypothetical protein
MSDPSTSTPAPTTNLRPPNLIDLNYIRKAHWMDFRPESYNGSNLISCLESFEMGLLIRNASYIWMVALQTTTTLMQY